MKVPLTVNDFLRRAELVYGDRVGIVDEPDQPAPSLGSLTYRDVAARARAQAAALDALGVGVGERVAMVSHNAARLLVSVMQDPHSRGAMTAILRAAVSEPEAADLIRELLTQRMLLPIARQLGGEQPELRASLMASSLVGVAVVRHIVRVEPLASASPEQLAAAIEPVFEHYLNGKWVLPSGSARGRS